MRPFLLLSATLAGAVLVPRTAFALQPVEVFLKHAKEWNPDNRAARAEESAKRSEVTVATGPLLPSISASADYTRNQYEITAGSLLPSLTALSTNLELGIAVPGAPQALSQLNSSVITPQDQVDGNIGLTVPIISVASWDRRAAAEHTMLAAKAESASTGQAVAKAVVRTYYQLLGTEAVAQSAEQNLEVTKNNLQLARDRSSNGTGSELEVQRAVADDARARQTLSAAGLQVTELRRSLCALTGVAPEPAAAFAPEDLHEEEPLEAWLGGTSKLPSVTGADEARLAAAAHVRSAKTTWLPTVAAVGDERFTNATAFTAGHSSIYLVELVASIRLDTTIVAGAHAAEEELVAARAREDKARQAAEDAVSNDWDQIRTDIDQARSVRAAVVATQLAAKLAEERYQNGVATQLDVLAARQEAFAADVARIQVDADLAYARSALRLDSGRTAASTR